MPVKRRSAINQVLAGLVLVVVALVVVLVLRVSGSGTSPAPPPSSGPASHSPGRVIGSMFQDDDHLIYASSATVRRTLDTLRGLGVNQIRATVVWKAIAPDPASSVPPSHFDATDPAAYPAVSWAPYDRLVQLARARGISVDFNVTDPGPLWAMPKGAPSAKYADHWLPDSAAFGRFVRAVGWRYDGSYLPASGSTPLPRVSFWSISNEPNQPGWLAPQWRSTPRGPVMEAPALYRAHVDAAFAALARTGHRPGSDTILVGELAPEGCVAGVSCIYPRPEWPIPPLPFLQALYCVDAGYRPLTGGGAASLGCPRAPDPHAFVIAHPGLFRASGLAHHPYSFFLAPGASMSNPAFAPLANLKRLETALDSIFATYKIGRHLPVYLTEYGYETNPPNPYRGVSPQRQSLYLNQAEYLAWRDPRVSTLSQFLLYDSPPNRAFPRGSPGYWSTFQTGLLYADGRAKPSLDSYRLPIFLPDPVVAPGRRALVWAMLRAARRGTRQRAQVQWRPSHPGARYRTLEQVTSDASSEVVDARVPIPGPGLVRVVWGSPSGQMQYSRAAPVRAR